MVNENTSFLREGPIEALAIIRRTHIAIEDHSGDVCLVFSTYTTESSAADQWVSPKDSRFMSLWNAMEGNVDNLNGKACMVTTGDGFIVFERMVNI